MLLAPRIEWQTGNGGKPTNQGQRALWGGWWHEFRNLWVRRHAVSIPQGEENGWLRSPFIYKMQNLPFARKKKENWNMYMVLMTKLQMSLWFTYILYIKSKKLYREFHFINEKILGLIPTKNTKCIALRKMSLMSVWQLHYKAPWETVYEVWHLWPIKSKEGKTN